MEARAEVLRGLRSLSVTNAPIGSSQARVAGVALGDILVANSPDPTGLATTAHHTSGIPEGQSGTNAHPIPATGPRREASKTVVPRKRYRGFESPPLRFKKAKNSGSRPGPRGRVFASSERVRWQLGGKLATMEQTAPSGPSTCFVPAWVSLHSG